MACAPPSAMSWWPPTRARRGGRGSCSVAGGGGLMRIGLFVTCLTDTLFPGTGQAVVTVLERLGHQVEFPMAQACCGQMHFNTGYRREPVPMARGFTAAFGGYEAVVTPSASCASMVREYFPALAIQARDPGLARAVAEVAPRTYELLGPHPGSPGHLPAPAGGQR